ncbi:hydrogenase maturation nickel metallochaperone HypA [Saccharopolyspora spinosa]|uniref:Hydrogenase maturation factor HypA n=1 Tax=Saccharopolyspora spinosa TaxID=60894 RepID=A0A2N3XYW6_SACSN|nr:hydrogenase/urease maturation nickel metallochaperone HypA [Saccharopolyspora spinosa]PKW15877.1 hydrogenase-3 nickel incorporation protein HypA [Saccharopolyspora spinosa]
MHELGITQSIVDAVLDAVEEPTIKCVHLEVGRLSGVVPDAIRFCFELVADGTRLASARLDITEPAGRGECRSCAREIDMDDLITRCACGGVDIAVLAGQELRIKAVEVG